jgi:hypothetical protein
VTHGHPTFRSHRPLVVAESALIKTDPFLELVAGYLKLHPGPTLEVIGWLWCGKAYARARLLERLPQYRETIPLDSVLLELAEHQAASGRQVYLCADRGVLGDTDVKARWPWITGIIRWQPELDGRHPGTDLNSFPEGIEHLGNSAQHSARPFQLWALIESVRLHQWIKNVLVFAPLILGGRLDNAHALLATVVAFLALGLVASATYLLNDILDVADDDPDRLNRPPLGDPAESPVAPRTALGVLIALGIAALRPSTRMIALGAFMCAAGATAPSPTAYRSMRPF